MEAAGIPQVDESLALEELVGVGGVCESQPGSCIPAEGAKPISVGVSFLLGSRGSHHPPERDVVNDASTFCWVA